MESDFKRLQIDNDLLDDVKNSVVFTFTELFGIKLSPVNGKISAHHISRGDLSGIVGMVQERLEGNLVVCFPKDCILHILQTAYGSGLTAINSSVRQGVAEIANVIYGQVKLRLNQRGYAFKMAIPNVIVGDGHEVEQVHESLSMILEFGFEQNKFEVVISLQESKVTY